MGRHSRSDPAAGAAPPAGPPAGSAAGEPYVPPGQTAGETTWEHWWEKTGAQPRIEAPIADDPPHLTRSAAPSHPLPSRAPAARPPVGLPPPGVPRPAPFDGPRLDPPGPGPGGPGHGGPGYDGGSGFGAGSAATNGYRPGGALPPPGRHGSAGYLPASPPRGPDEDDYRSGPLTGTGSHPGLLPGPIAAYPAAFPPDDQPVNGHGGGYLALPGPIGGPAGPVNGRGGYRTGADDPLGPNGLPPGAGPVNGHGGYPAPDDGPRGRPGAGAVNGHGGYPLPDDSGFDPGPVTGPGGYPGPADEPAGATGRRGPVRAVPDPDDTGSRRRRRRAADDDLPPDRAGSPALRAVDPAPDGRDGDTDDDDYADEPALILQWGMFVLQTIFGAASGLGIWLGFHVLWERYPFYAAAGVGGSVTVLLVVARWLRRRYGHDLDLLTSIIVVGIGVVLTVLPAAFSLQNR